MRRSIAMWLIYICISTSGWAGDSALKGPSFDPEAQAVPMPDDWATSPFNYPKELRDADLVLSFGQQTYPALASIVREYAKARDLKVAIQSGTCGISAGKLLRKAIDSGAFCCPPGRNDRLPGLEYHTIGISPIAVIVNKANAIDGLSLAQARAIFQGKHLKWDEVAPQANLTTPIKVVGRLHCKMRPGHWRLLLKEPKLFSPTLVEVGVIPDLLAKIGQLQNGISIETPFMVRSFDKAQRVKMLKLNGVSPLDNEKVATGQYPLYRTYSLTSWKDSKRRDEVLKLIEFVRDFVESHHEGFGFVPVSMLRKAGWQFRGNELVGEPDGDALAEGLRH